jgi:hypothetical protein
VLRRVADVVSTRAAQLQGLLVTGSLTAGPGGYASAGQDPRSRLEGTPYGRLMLLVLQAAEQTALRFPDGLEGFHRPLAVAYMLQSTLVPLSSDAVGTVENRLKDLTGHGRTPSQMFAAAAARPAWLPTGVLGSGGLSSGLAGIAAPPPRLASLVAGGGAERSRFTPARPWIASTGALWDGVTCPICGVAGHAFSRCPSGPASASERWFTPGQTWAGMPLRATRSAAASTPRGPAGAGRGGRRRSEGGRTLHGEDTPAPAAGGAGGNA